MASDASPDAEEHPADPVHNTGAPHTTGPASTPSGYPSSWTAGAPYGTGTPPAYPGYPADPSSYPSAAYPPAAYPPAAYPPAPYPSAAWSYADAKPAVDGFAITSLITGLLGGFVFSVGFGIAALVRISRGRRRGRALAITGLALSLVWVIGLVAVVAYRQGREPERDTSGTITRQGQVAPADLHVGDCVRVPRILDGTYTALTVVPCAQSHNGQVFTILRAQDPGAYPGDASVRAGAIQDCRAAFPAFLGTTHTLLHIVAFFPPEKSWDIGRRDEHCLLVDRAKNFTGDVRSDR